MNYRKIWSRKKPASKTLWLLTAVVLMLIFSQHAFASTAANTTITNTVTVSFDDSVGNPQIDVDASTTVTVTLVAAAPTLNSPPNIDPTTEGALNPLTYIISSNANGPDTYTLGELSVDDANLSAPVMVNNAPANPIALGATTLAVAAVLNDPTITVPYDGTNDTIVNGIAVNDWIVIGTDVYQVTIIAETPASNSATLTLDNLIATAAAVGTIVGEQVTFTLDVTTGTLSAGSNGNHTITMTATSVADNSQSTPQATATIITVRRPELTVGKFVRNVSQPAMTGSGASASDGTNQYWPTGITGEPGDILAFLIVVQNPAGSGQATDVIIEDQIPPFTAYVAGSMLLDDGLGPFNPVTDVDTDSDAGEYDGTAGSETVWIYAGSGGTGTSGAPYGDGTGGTLNGGETTRGVFRVTIQ